MKSKNTLQRVLSGLASPIGLVLLILFFLPWTKLSCAGETLGTATGWQLTVGEMSDSERMQEMSPDESAAEEGDEQGPDARPWFILGLLAPIGVLLISFLGLSGKTSSLSTGSLLGLTAVVGVIVVIAATQVDYADEMMEQQQAESPPVVQPEEPADTFGPELGPFMEEASQGKMAAMIETETLVSVWFSLALYIVLLLSGLAMMLLRFVPQLVGQATPAAPAAAAPVTPPAPAPQAERDA